MTCRFVRQTKAINFVIAGYYMEAVGELAGFPQLVRGHMGAENGHPQPKKRRASVCLEKVVCRILDGHPRRLERQR